MDDPDVTVINDRSGWLLRSRCPILMSDLSMQPPKALDNSLLKALAKQLEAIATGKANTPAALRTAAAAATEVAAMLQASALDLDLDADRDRGAAVARVEPGEAVVRTNSSPNWPSELKRNARPLPPTPSQPNPLQLILSNLTPQRPYRPPRSACRRRPSDK